MIRSWGVESYYRMVTYFFNCSHLTLPAKWIDRFGLEMTIMGERLAVAQVGEYGQIVERTHILCGSDMKGKRKKVNFRFFW